MDDGEYKAGCAISLGGAVFAGLGIGAFFAGMDLHDIATKTHDTSLSIGSDMMIGMSIVVTITSILVALITFTEMSD